MNTTDLTDAICDMMNSAGDPLSEFQRAMLAGFLGGYFINEKPLTISEINQLNNLDKMIKEQQQ